MKKANKILMATVAILLSLVLITTSVVSGIFARFTVLQEAKTKMTLNKFGVSLGLELSDEFVEFLDREEVVADMTENGDSISIVIPKFKMAPGDEFWDAVKISVNNTPNVNCTFKLQFDITYNDNDFKVPKSISGAGSNITFMPIGFKLKTLNASDSSVIANEVDLAYSFLTYGHTQYSYTIPKNLSNYMDLDHTENDNYTTNYVTKDFSSGTAAVFHPKNDGTVDNSVNIKDFYVGFGYPFNYVRKNYNCDAIATYLTDKKTSAQDPLTFDIKYTVSIEQTS